MKPFYIYMILCSDDSYYVGHTDDIEKRIAEHELGEVACYTATRLPIKVIFTELFETREEAIAMERQIKKWSRKKKQALAQNDWNMVSCLAKKNFKK